MKKLLFTLAAAASFAAMADSDPAASEGVISHVGFEAYPTNVSVVTYNDQGQSDNSLWTTNGTGDDASVVKKYGGDNATAPALDAYPAPFTDGGNQYLALDTSGDELQRQISAAGQAIAAGGTFIDTLVQFTVTEDEEPTVDSTTKLAIWMGVDTNAVPNTINLYVKGGFYVGAELEDGRPTGLPSVSTQTYKLSGTYQPATWYRLTVKAIKFVESGESTYAGFQIYIDGTLLTTVADAYDSNAMVAFGMLSGCETSLLTNKTMVPSAYASLDDGTLKSVGFMGTGALDDLVVTETDPFPPAVVDFTLTWGEGVDAVSYVLSTDLATTNTLTSGTAVQLAPGDGTAMIELIPTFTTGYEFDKVTMGETELGLTFAIPGVTTNATLFAKAATPAYPTYIDTTDATIKGKYDAWKNTYQADTQSAWETAFLLNMDPTESVAAGTALLKIASITEVSGGWELEIVSDATTLTAETNNDGLVGNGYLAITYAADLATLTSGGTTVNLPVTVTDGKIKVTVSAPGAKFMKATLTSTPASQE